MRNFKQKLYEYTIITLVACMAVFLVVNLTMKSTDLKSAEEIKKSSENIKNIQTTLNDQQVSLNIINEQLLEIDTTQSMYIDALKENTRWQQMNYKKMQQLRELYDEKINTASNYNYTQIDSFFSAKYRHRKN